MLFRFFDTEMFGTRRTAAKRFAGQADDQPVGRVGTVPIPSGRRRFRLRTFAATLVGCVALASLVIACDTPVYRYAMYRWLPAPYEVYLFHSGTIDENGEAVQQAIEKQSESDGPVANIVFLPVNLEEDKELTGVPPDVKDAWLAQSEKKTPMYMISSPAGGHLLTGDFSKSQIASLIDSPVRQEIGKILESGKAGVFLLVTGDDDEADQAAQKTLREVVADVNSGKVSLYQAPPAMFGGPAEAANEGGDDAEEPAGPPTPQMGLVELKRGDATESWLLKCLMALEPDLAKRTEPMIFTIYGRGRAVFSCLGKGINRDNLVMDVEFITGACSCTVKEQNPGVDLLMTYDWEAAAAAISEKFGAEEGSQYQFGGDQLFPELIIPSSGESAQDSQNPSGESSEQEAPPADGVDPSSMESATDSEPGLEESTDTEETSQPAPEDSAQEPGKTDEVNAAADAQRVAAAEPSDSADATSSTLTVAKRMPTRGVLFVGIGLAVVFVILLAVTFVVLRP